MRIHLARTTRGERPELSPFRFLKAITKVTSRTESFLAGKRKSAIMQWKRQFPVVLSRRSVSPFPVRLLPPTGGPRLFAGKPDGKFRGPDTPTFNTSSVPPLGTFHPQFAHRLDTRAPFVAINARHRAPDRRSQNDAVEDPSDE